MTPLLEVRGLVKRFPVRRGLLQRQVGAVHAVDGVDLDVTAGECLALVGESGSGKTTLGRLVTRLEEADAGTLRFDGEDLLALSGAALRRRRRDIQVVFQDPWSSLNPRMTVGAAVREPIAVHRLMPARQQGERVAATSTMRPRYITATRSASCSTSARSWAMNSIARPSWRCRSASRLTICARTETSSADTGSSHTMNFGSTESARAMPTRWRCPPENSCG